MTRQGDDRAEHQPSIGQPFDALAAPVAPNEVDDRAEQQQRDDQEAGPRTTTSATWPSPRPRRGSPSGGEREPGRAPMSTATSPALNPRPRPGRRPSFDSSRDDGSTRARAISRIHVHGPAAVTRASSPGGQFDRPPRDLADGSRPRTARRRESISRPTVLRGLCHRMTAPTTGKPIHPSSTQPSPWTRQHRRRNQEQQNSREDPEQPHHRAPPTQTPTRAGATVRWTTATRSAAAASGSTRSRSLAAKASTSSAASYFARLKRRSTRPGPGCSTGRNSGRGRQRRPGHRKRPGLGRSRQTAVTTRAYTPSTTAGHHCVGEGPADQPIDLEQPVAHDGDADGDRWGGRGQDQERAPDRDEGAAHECHDHDEHSGGEPPVLQALDTFAAAIPLADEDQHDDQQRREADRGDAPEWRP